MKRQNISLVSYYFLALLAILHSAFIPFELFFGSEFDDKLHIAFRVFQYWFVWPFVLAFHPARSKIRFWIPVLISLILMTPVFLAIGFFLLNIGAHQ